MRLPPELTLSERLALELTPIVELSSNGSGQQFEWTPSNSIALSAFALTLLNIGYTVFSGIRRRWIDDRRYDFDTAFGDVVQASMVRLDTAIEMVSQAANEPTVEKRSERISEIQRTQINTWYFSLDGLLYGAKYPSAPGLLDKLQDFWDEMGMSLNAISTAQSDAESAAFVKSLNREIKRFRSDTIAEILKDRKAL